MYDLSETLDALPTILDQKTNDTGVVPTALDDQIMRTITCTREDGCRLEVTAYELADGDDTLDVTEVLVVMRTPHGIEIDHLWESVEDGDDWGLRAALVAMWGAGLVHALHTAGLRRLRPGSRYAPPVEGGDRLDDSGRGVVAVSSRIEPGTGDIVTVARARDDDFEDLDTWMIYPTINGEDVSPRELNTEEYIRFCEAVGNESLAAAVAELA